MEGNNENASLRTYISGLLRKTKVQQGSRVIIIDDNAKPPLDYSSLSLCSHYRCEYRSSSNQFDLLPTPPPPPTSRWDSDTSPAASTRNAKSGLGLPRRRSKRQLQASCRERCVRRGAISIPSCHFEISPLNENEKKPQEQGATFNDIVASAIRAIKADGDLGISEEFTC
jgi:hypothetical protein